MRAVCVPLGVFVRAGDEGGSVFFIFVSGHGLGALLSGGGWEESVPVDLGVVGDGVDAVAGVVPRLDVVAGRMASGSTTLVFRLMTG